MNENVIIKGTSTLRCGYTTGSCATAAATAAALMIMSKERIDAVTITLPDGQHAVFELKNILLSKEVATCSVIKDAGDDPDITNGIEISAKVSLCESGYTLSGGNGVGTVTEKGLPCAIGEPAINPVPREMIKKNVFEILRKYSYNKGISIEISAINGEEISKHTFNTRLGIVGGISILGTTGIVEPMSERALVDTIKVLINKAKTSDSYDGTVLISPGNYGRDYCKNNLSIDIDSAIKCSNYIGETLDYLVYKQFSKILLVGHIGKLVKLAGGIMNTHSAVADCRMEILAVHAATHGANSKIVQAIMECKTTDTAIAIIKTLDKANEIFASILKKIIFHINYRTKEKLNAEVIIFSSDNELLIQTDNAKALALTFALANSKKVRYNK